MSYELTDNDRKLLVEAYEVATESPDPSTQIGAVIPFRMMVGNSLFNYSIKSCNTFPYGVKSTPERLERPLKYEFVEHAERGAVYQAAHRGLALKGKTMYIPWFACTDCARAIICSGIVRVIGHQRMMDATPQRWKDSIASAFIMMEEAGIEIVTFKEELPEAPKIRFNGELWQP